MNRRQHALLRQNLQAFSELKLRKLQVRINIARLCSLLANKNVQTNLFILALPATGTVLFSVSFGTLYAVLNFDHYIKEHTLAVFFSLLASAHVFIALCFALYAHTKTFQKKKTIVLRTRQEFHWVGKPMPVYAAQSQKRSTPLI